MIIKHQDGRRQLEPAMVIIPSDNSLVIFSFAL
jgi:hypothetical protein